MDNQPVQEGELSGVPCEACGTLTKTQCTLMSGVACEDCTHDWFDNGITSKAVLRERRLEGRTLETDWKSRSEILQEALVG
jgi:hypothetical protein